MGKLYNFLSYKSHAQKEAIRLQKLENYEAQIQALSSEARSIINHNKQTLIYNSISKIKSKIKSKKDKILASVTPEVIKVGGSKKLHHKNKKNISKIKKINYKNYKNYTNYKKY